MKCVSFLCVCRSCYLYKHFVKCVFIKVDDIYSIHYLFECILILFNNNTYHCNSTLDEKKGMTIDIGIISTVYCRLKE